VTAEDASPSHDATTAHDAAVDVSSHRPDGAADASGHDAPGDVRGEAALDAHVVRFCHTVDATFCADFDEGALSEAGFTSIPSGATATGLVDTTLSLSPPASVKLAATGSGGCEYSELVREFSDRDATAGAEIVFDVHADYLGDDAATPVGSYVGALGTPDCTFIVSLGADQCTLRVQYKGVDGGPTEIGQTGMLGVPVTSNGWTKVDLDVTLPPGAKPADAGSASLKVNGASYVTVAPLPAVCKGPATTTLYAGVYCDRALVMHIDNLAFYGK
jgi:hypothetical protein